ncbi:hypothetical protein GGF31_003474 [Allomyces arbusculus]|nr:hypothetical protein GGF31_003474 [Allomyces arbusculus]
MDLDKRIAPATTAGTAPATVANDSAMAAPAAGFVIPGSPPGTPARPPTDNDDGPTDNDDGPTDNDDGLPQTWTTDIAREFTLDQPGLNFVLVVLAAIANHICTHLMDGDSVDNACGEFALDIDELFTASARIVDCIVDMVDAKVPSLLRSGSGLCIRNAHVGSSTVKAWGGAGAGENNPNRWGRDSANYYNARVLAARLLIMTRNKSIAEKDVVDLNLASGTYLGHTFTYYPFVIENGFAVANPVAINTEFIPLTRTAPPARRRHGRLHTRSDDPVVPVDSNSSPPPPPYGDRTRKHRSKPAMRPATPTPLPRPGVRAAVEFTSYSSPWSRRRSPTKRRAESPATDAPATAAKRHRTVDTAARDTARDTARDMQKQQHPPPAPAARADVGRVEFRMAALAHVNGRVPNVDDEAVAAADAAFKYGLSISTMLAKLDKAIGPPANK